VSSVAHLEKPPIALGFSHDGVDDYEDLSDTGTEWDFQTFSVSFWIKTKDTGKEIMGEGAKWRPLTASGGAILFWIRGLKDGVDSVDTLTGIKNVCDDVWHHVVCTYELSTLKMQIFADGSLDNSKTTAVEIYADGNNNQAIGRGYVGSPSFIEAIISEVHIYNRVLSLAEIGDLYSIRRNIMDGCVLKLGTVGLVRGGGTQWLDESPYKNHGTVYGAKRVRCCHCNVVRDYGT